MRFKIVFAILLAGALGLGVIFYLKQSGTPPLKPIAENSSAPTNIVANLSAPATPIIASKPAMTPEQREAAVDAEIDRLQDWEMSNDPQSLSNILGDLTSPEKEIRDAAIEATKQFGSTNAIPVLKALAVNTQDTDEQIALLDAADFLSLPSITAGGIHPANPENAKTQALHRPGRKTSPPDNSTPDSPPQQQ